MTLATMIDRSSSQVLPPFSDVPRDEIAPGARMTCLLDRDLDFHFLDRLIERHWADYFAKEVDSRPVLTLHVRWTDLSDSLALAGAAIGDGLDELTSFNDPSHARLPEGPPQPEADLARAFLADLLGEIFIDEKIEYEDLFGRWHTKISSWRGHDFCGTASFHLSLHDRGIVLVRDSEEPERLPAFVVTDAENSDHALLDAHRRVSNLPRGILDWCQGGSQGGKSVALARG